VKTCPECGQSKPLRSGFYRWKNDGKPYWSRVCRVCVRERSRRNYRKNMADPYTAEKERERRRNYPDRKGPQNAERCKRYRERMKRERPDAYARYLEDARMRRKLANELAGKTLRPATTNWVGKGHYVYLDPAPILTVALAMKDTADPTVARSIRRLITGESRHVELSVVDAITLRAGLSPHDVYPELVA